MPLNHSNFSSNCSTLAVGCKLRKFDGSPWTDADAVSGVVGGKFSDGTFCYTVSNGLITLKEPHVASLSVSYINGQFSAILSDALSCAITISSSSLNVYGYSDSGCTSLEATDFALADLTINAGETTGSIGGSYPLFCNPVFFYHFPGTQLSINNGLGVSNYSNFSTFTCGGTTVTLYFPDNVQCLPYC